MSKRFHALNTERLLAILAAQELKRWWVAECAGVHKSTLRRWLSGQIQRVKTENILVLASVLNVSPDDIAQRY